MTATRHQWMKFVRAYAIIVAATVASALVVFNWFRSLRTYYVDEDSLVENLSVAFYLGAFLLAVGLAWKSRHRRWTTLGVGLVGLVGFLDETSFGERWIGVHMPTFFGVKVDAFHDVFYLAYHLMPRVSSHPLFPLSAVAIVAVPTVYFGRHLVPTVREWLAGIYRHPAFTIFVVAVVQIAAALVIDLQIVRVKGIFMLEEVFEMNAAIALVFCAWSLREPQARNS
jgi:hypothetical protein